MKFSKQFLLLVLFSLLFFFYLPCQAEEIEPRRWAHLPIDTNFAGAAYVYTDADIAFDPVLKLEDVQAEVNTFGAKYIRTFSLFDKSARVSIMQGYQDGRWTGLLDGVPTSVKRNGLTDTFLRFAINIYGAPPLQGKDYVEYRSAAENETIVGAGLAVQLPTGEYMDDKLINLGTNRFTFRPQCGIIHTRGNWSFETTGVIELYTDNNDFLNDHELEKDPLYIIHSHLIYTFSPGVWASASGGYNYGGRSTVDNEKKDDRNQNLAWAFSFGFPVSRHFGFKLAYVGTRTQESSGSDTDSFALGFSGFW